MDQLKQYFMQQGVFSWTELMTTDVALAKNFYGDLLGWTFQDQEMACGGTYSMAIVNGRPVAGLCVMPPAVPAGVPPHWGAYVTVNDVDEATKKAESLGGRVLVAPMDIPGIGRFSVIADPQGAAISLFSFPSDAKGCSCCCSKKTD